MKKKLISVLLVITLLAAGLAGCKTKEASKMGTTDGGKVLNIYCWNTEFQDRVKDFYPNYVHNQDGSGTIGDVKVNWLITPSENLAYQNALDAALLAQGEAKVDDRVDLFLIEADYALKYVNSTYSVDIKDLGIKDADLANQYQYTRDIVTDSKDAQKGTTWQATPGLFAYRRSIAKDVLGTDNPADVQNYLSNWDKFNDVAKQAKSKGYTMLSGYDDSYRTFSNNVSGPWVQKKKVIVDDNLMKWVDQTKEYTEKGYNNKTALWDDAWSAGQGPDGKTFGYFYSTWGINFTLLEKSLADPAGELEVGNGNFGDWAVCEGPQPYYWGGTWICAADGTDNTGIIKDLMLTLTSDKATMKKITEVTQDYTNHKAAMEELANSNFESDFLGGQNHIALFSEAATKIDMSNVSSFDQGCNEEFQKAFKDYFDGNVTKDEALTNFFKNIKIKYPELKK